MLDENVIPLIAGITQLREMLTPGVWSDLGSCRGRIPALFKLFFGFWLGVVLYSTYLSSVRLASVVMQEGLCPDCQLPQLLAPPARA